MTRQTIFWALVFSAATTVCEAAEWRYKGPESSNAPATTEQATSATAESTDQAAAPAPAAADLASTGESQTTGPMPTNNMFLVKVREQFGDPQEEVPAVGQPPILRWKYPSYMTYFEVDRVIISVPLSQ